MQKLSSEVRNFFQNQDYVIVSSIDGRGFPHNACKGIVHIDPEGKIYLLDIYKAKTFQNLKRHPQISITAVDGHKFVGYSLKGKVVLDEADKINPELLEAWESRITSRITQRVLKNVLDKKGHPKHPEALFPKPRYMIVFEVEDIVDLTPRHLK